MPRVTIIIPTYNRPALLPRALASVARQTICDYEVIVVNDGGEWPAECIPSISGHSVRVLHRSRGGPAAARNTGLNSSDSEYVAYLDDDDEWQPEHLERLVRLLNNSPKYAVAFGVAELVDSGAYVRLWGDCRFDKFILDGFHTVFPLSACLHRRDILRRSGLFDEHTLLIGPEDCEFMIRVSDHVVPIASRQVTVRMHRDHSMTRGPREQWVDVLEYVIGKNGYGVTRRNWLMFYRALVAAVNEGRDELVEQWARQLDRELPQNLRRSALTIQGDIELRPAGIKTFCRSALEG
jgi:glycosyltransferase involved in cell wall biosynthesis